MIRYEQGVQAMSTKREDGLTDKRWDGLQQKHKEGWLEVPVRYGEERERLILRALSMSRGRSVPELAAMLHVAQATVRRDLGRLSKAGLIRRTHGGAIPLSADAVEVPLGMRMTDMRQEKTAIAEAAALLVNDGETLFLDSSSTTLHMIPFLRARKGLTIITNGLQTALELSRSSEIRVYVTGGQLREQARSFTGVSAVENIRRYTAARVFLSCRAVDSQFGLSDNEEEEAMIRREMMTCSRETVVLADHGKLGARAPFCISRWDRVHWLITDRVLPEAFVSECQAASVKVKVANASAKKRREK
jgi:DeoR/GlpR family transcriptional regulator of sugar metabolism